MLSTGTKISYLAVRCIEILSVAQRIRIASRRVIFTSIVTAISLAHVHGYEPRLFKLEELPDSLIPYYYGVRTENGLMVISTRGVAMARGSEWSIRNIPGAFSLQTASDHPKGLVAAFADGVKLHDGEEWRDLPLDNWVTGRMVRLGDSVFAGTYEGVDRIDPAGQTSRVLEFPASVGIATPYLLDGKLVVLTVKPNAAYEWDGTKFRREPIYDKFVSDQGPQPYLSPRGESEGVFFDGEKCFPHSPEGTSDAVIRRIFDSYQPISNYTRPIIGENYFYGVSQKGVECYSLDDGELKFIITGESIDSSIYSIGWGPEGLLVFATDGVYALPDPDYVSYVESKMANILSRRVATQNGPLQITRRGVFKEDGSIVTDLPVENPIDGLELSTGELVLADQNGVFWGDRRFPIAGFTNGVVGIWEIDPDRVLVQLFEQLITISADGEVHRSELLEGVDEEISFLRDRKEIAVLVGSEIVFFAENDLRELRRFGRDIRTVFRKDSGSELNIIGAEGTWYSVEGKALRKNAPWPYHPPVDLSVEEDSIFCYGTVADNRRMFMRIDVETGDFIPLDVPAHLPALSAEWEDGQLKAVFPSEVLTIQGAPRPLSRPNAKATIWADGHQLDLATNLPTELDEVELRLPRARVVPWTNPNYSIKIGTRSWQEVKAGSYITVSRLTYGATDIRVRAVDAIWAEEHVLSLYRQWPWWARWPGWLIGGLIVLGIAQGTSVIRSRGMKRRNLKLEGIVASRTEELRAARTKAEEASSVKGEFIASMNHEIRNPMNGIVGLTRILGDGESNPRRRMLLGTLEACTEQLRGSLDDVLDFNQIERGEIVLQTTDFDWSYLVRSCCNGVDTHGAAFSLELSESAQRVSGDSGKVRQILSNFLTNALKYGNPPGGTVRLLIADRDPGQCWARIEVVSWGRVLDEVERRKLFEIFFRGSRASETKAPGTGLGLALSRRFAEALGASVGVSPEADGNQFWLEIVLPRAPEIADADEDLTESGLKGRLILAVEDENYNRLVLDHYLRTQGIEVDWAATATRAIEMIKMRPYQAILTDWLLPDADGSVLLPKLSEANGGSLPPVVAMSAYATAEKRAEILAAGAVNFVPKPVDDKRLTAVLRQVLAGAPAIVIAEPAETETLPQPDALKFDRLAALGDFPVVIKRFTVELEQSWSAIRQTWNQQPEQVSSDLHRLRSQVLVIEAHDLSRKMGLLESALGSPQGRESAVELVDEIQQLVDELLLKLNAFDENDEHSPHGASKEA